MPYDTRPRDADKGAKQSIAEAEALGACPPVFVDEDSDPNAQPRERDYRIKNTKADDRVAYTPFKITVTK